MVPTGRALPFWRSEACHRFVPPQYYRRYDPHDHQKTLEKLQEVSAFRCFFIAFYADMLLNCDPDQNIKEERMRNEY